MEDHTERFTQAEKDFMALAKLLDMEQLRPDQADRYGLAHVPRMLAIQHLTLARGKPPITVVLFLGEDIDAGLQMHICSDDALLTPGFEDAFGLILRPDIIASN